MDTPDYFDKNSGRSEAKENVLNRRLIGHLHPAPRPASSPHFRLYRVLFFTQSTRTTCPILPPAYPTPYAQRKDLGTFAELAPSISAPIA